MNVIQKALMAALVLLLAACSADTHNVAGQHPAEAIQLAQKSVINKGAGIKLTFSSEDTVQVGNEVRVALVFTALPNQPISLQFADSAAFQLLIESQQLLRTNEQGVLALDLVFIPLQAGKMYIKFFAHAERAGQMIPQVFSIPVYVGDDEGVVPYEQSSESQPLTMPANRF